MAAPLHNANGHRRRELRKRVLAEESQCALCDKPVDKTLTNTPGGHGPKCPGGATAKAGGVCKGCTPHPQRAEVDEDIPRSRGGSPYDRGNCRLMHRECNQWKSALTLAEARAKWQKQQQTQNVRTIRASSIW